MGICKNCGALGELSVWGTCWALRACSDRMGPDIRPEDAGPDGQARILARRARRGWERLWAANAAA